MKIMFGLICLLTFATGVNAAEYAEPLASIMKDGYLYVDAPVPKTQEELTGINNILKEQYKEYLQDDEEWYDKSLTLIECSSDYSTCLLSYTAIPTTPIGYGSAPIEVSVKWQENYSEEFKKVAPDGVLEISAIKPTNAEEMDFYVNNHFLSLYPTGNVYGYLDNCNEEQTECDLSIHVYDNAVVTLISEETHKVNVIWQEADASIKQMIDGYIEKIDNSRIPATDSSGLSIVSFELTDLNKINFLNHVTSANNMNDMNKAIKYSKTVKEMFENSNIDYYLDVRAGDAIPMQLFGWGGLTLYYNDVIYGLVDYVGLAHKNVIYIPSETENTKEAYIAAAKKRIDEYLGNDSTKIVVADLRESLDIDYSELGDESKMGDYYYDITVGDVTEQFVIIRDSSKIEKTSYDTKDVETNISISSTSAEIPLDTSIKVEVIEEKTEQFKKIVDILKVEVAQVYDLKLYSKSNDKFISKLSNGEFQVTVPIGERLKGKELVAYYITDNNEIEEHPVTIVNGMARFTTNHFSIYTIAEKKVADTNVLEDVLDEEVPNTFDGIMNYVFVGIIGLVGLSVVGLGFKKREN